MSTKIFVNLSVSDLPASIQFFTSVGFSFNQQFTDDNATCMVISDSIFVMLLVKPFFKTFTKKEIADATVTESIIALSADSREKVDELADKAMAAGATQVMDPKDQGFMYTRSFYDLDGHHWEIFWMDPAAIQ